MKTCKVLTYKEIENAAELCAGRIAKAVEGADKDEGNFGPLKIFGIPRGGVAAAILVEKVLPLWTNLVEDAADADVFVDDIIDSGRTENRYMKQYPGKIFESLYRKGPEWLVFPWDGGTQQSAEDIPVRLLQFIGEDPQRGGLKQTPGRYLSAWTEWTRGYGEKAADILTAFEDGAEQYDELVLVRDIPVYSHCEHHLAPFFGKAHVAYLPNKRIVGLSKLARLVNVFARRLQVQERLTSQVAHALQVHMQPQGVAVVLECRHLCMESRGVCVPGAVTTTSCLLGALRDVPEARAEFMRLVR
jgi:GTP cyclohydrolase IA